MTPDQLARNIWIKAHMARLLQARAQQLGNQREARGKISNQIGRLNQQVTNLKKKLDALTADDDE